MTDPGEVVDRLAHGRAGASVLVSLRRAYGSWLNKLP